jgi:hypothetical protein
MSNFPLPYSSLKRSTKRIRPRKKAEVRIGKVSGKVRLSGNALEALRVMRYQIDGERCTWHKGKPDACDVWLPLYASVFNRAHLAHIVSRGAGGSDTIANTTIRCFHHHIEIEHTTGEKG